MKQTLDLSIVIVSHGHEAVLPVCLDSLGAATAGLAVEIILIDNLQRGGVAVAAQRRPVRVLENSEPEGFARNVNRGVAAASGRYILLLNPDTWHVGGGLATALAFMESRPTIGIVGCTLLNPDGSVQQSYRRFPTPGFLLVRGLGGDRWPWQPGFYRRGLMAGERTQTPHAVDWVFGAFMLMRRAEFERHGGMDERFRLYYEDVDLCHRFDRAGLATYVMPELRFVHQHMRHSAASPLSAQWRWHVRSAARYFYKVAALYPAPRRVRR